MKSNYLDVQVADTCSQPFLTLISAAALLFMPYMIFNYFSVLGVPLFVCLYLILLIFLFSFY